MKQHNGTAGQQSIGNALTEQMIKCGTCKLPGEVFHEHVLTVSAFGIMSEQSS